MKKIIAVACISAILAGCAASNNPMQKPSGFLPNYNLLQSVATNSPDAQIYTYRNPALNAANYHAIIVNPVILYQTATTNGVSNDQIAATRDQLSNAIATLASQKLPLTTQPGPGVATLSVAITGAELDGEGFKPRNIMPISAAIKLASKATGVDNKKPVLVIELKIVDSSSGALLRETLTTISGDEFRLNSGTPQAFQQLAQKWIQQAYQYTSTPMPAGN